MQKVYVCLSQVAGVMFTAGGRARSGGTILVVFCFVLFCLVFFLNRKVPERTAFIYLPTKELQGCNSFVSTCVSFPS